MMKSLKQLIVFCSVAIIAIAAIGLFQKRDLYYQYWNKPNQQFVVDSELFKRMAHDFMVQAGGAVVILWEIDLGDNTRTTKVYQTEAGRTADLENRRANLFLSDARENRYVAYLLKGETYCGNLVTSSVIGVTLQNAGVTNLCRKPLIDPDGLLIGYITLGFRDMPSEEDIFEAKRSLDNVAPLIIKRVTKG